VTFEIILVDDRSPDNSWEVMKQLSTKFPEVKSIRLSRNFGQHPAIMAGLTKAKGEWVVVMDCDLQDQPEEINALYKKAIEGYDMVLASREVRKDNFFKILSSKIFARLYGYLTDSNFDNSVANFGIYNKKVIEEVLNMNDFIKSFPLFVQWVGFNKTIIKVEHAKRNSGKSSYTYRKLLSLAFNTIISFSNKPLKLVVKFGLLISILSLIIGILNLYQYSIGKISVVGYSSLIISIWLLSGIIITIIGVVGIYVGKIFDQVKDRKAFIIDKIID
jgi:glycosyltransferase involved in cell wall biosynthesis